MRLRDRVCIITGAAGDIGRAYAERFAEEGAVVAVADLDEEGAERTASAIADGGGRAFALPVDVASTESCRRAVADVLEREERVDVLFNNAALYGTIDLGDQSEEYLERVLSVNMLGAWRLSRAVTPSMIERGYGRIIHQSSTAAYTYLLSRPPTELPSFSYAWSKWGVNGLTKFMAGALGKHGITVNCIAPGVTSTEATERVVSPKMQERLADMTALGRVLSPEDMVGPAVFLASDDAGAVTGQILCVDGGMVMAG